MTSAEPLTVVPEADGLADVEENVYHRDPGSLSVSGAKLLLPPSCPAKFKERMDNPPPPKRVFEFGHLVHGEVLGKGVPTVEIDADNYRKKDAQEKRDAARAAGKVPVLIGDGANDEFAAELGKAKRMAAAVHADPWAGPLFKAGQAEVSLYHTDPATGLRKRGRLDWLTPDGDCDDVKTAATANPALLERQFWKLGYFMQAAWYMDLIIALGISENPVFRFVVVEKDPPHVVTVVRYDADAITEGRRQNRLAVDTYLRCRDRNEWPGYVQGEAELSLPRWVARDIAELEMDDVRSEADALIAELQEI